MGTGKSAVGRLLASQKGWPRFDTDEMIATAFKMPISEIFTRLGEERFREEETAVLEKLEVVQPSIIVTGGGAVMRPENVARLRELGSVVCLTSRSGDVAGAPGPAIEPASSPDRKSCRDDANAAPGTRAVLSAGGGFYGRYLFAQPRTGRSIDPRCPCALRLK